MSTWRKSEDSPVRLGTVAMGFGLAFANWVRCIPDEGEGEEGWRAELSKARCDPAKNPGGAPTGEARSTKTEDPAWSSLNHGWYHLAWMSKLGLWFLHQRRHVQQCPCSTAWAASAFKVCRHGGVFSCAQSARPIASFCREKGSNAKPSPNAACSTNGKPRNVINQVSQSLP